MIELLVVVAIIAVLVALLLPALAMARESARTAVCLSNQRQIGMAFYQYAQDYGGILPLAFRDNVSVEERWWCQILTTAKYLHLEDPAARRGIWICPSDQMQEPGGTNIYLGSYSYNIYMGLRNVDRIENPTGVAMMLDTQGECCCNPWASHLFNRLYHPRAEYRHPGGSALKRQDRYGINVLFVDGHAVTMQKIPYCDDNKAFWGCPD